MLLLQSQLAEWWSAGLVSEICTLSEVVGTQRPLQHPAFFYAYTFLCEIVFFAILYLCSKFEWWILMHTLYIDAYFMKQVFVLHISATAFIFLPSSELEPRYSTFYDKCLLPAPPGFIQTLGYSLRYQLQKFNWKFSAVS